MNNVSVAPHVPQDEVTCPLGHGFLITKNESASATMGRGWGYSDEGKVARIRVLRRSKFRSHAIFLICPTCGMLFKRK
jgi:hypothetical protein